MPKEPNRILGVRNNLSKDIEIHNYAQVPHIRLKRAIPIGPSDSTIEKLKQSLAARKFSAKKKFYEGIRDQLRLRPHPIKENYIQPSSDSDENKPSAITRLSKMVNEDQNFVNLYIRTYFDS
ncbi:hypothetical protein RF11_09632 [Thelohanellus kitauei]|uniref:Uncharacterized protein n=1 Tax=Thelohanellus kitauei TaxID=669202 RepID=A0A0C2M3X0_THEKT|nr:hypothetical protein RF11_09632 [Thelohanellus kitauei]